MVCCYIIKYVLVIFTANLHIFFHLDVIGSRLLMPFTKKRGLFVQKSVLWAPKAFYISKKVRRPVKFTAPKIVDDEGNVVG